MATVTAGIPPRLGMQIERSGDASLKEMLLEHIRLDKIWKANLEATLKIYGIHFKGDTNPPELDSEDEEEYPMSPPTLEPAAGVPSTSRNNHKSSENMPRRSCRERSDSGGSSQASGSIIPAALVRPVLADGSTYGGAGGSVVFSSAAKNVYGPARKARNSEQQEATTVSSSLKQRNQQFGGAVEKSKSENRRLTYLKDTEEATNHIEVARRGNGRVLRCKLCGHTEQTESAALTHVRMCHIGQDRKYACDLCSYRFKQRSHLTYHMEHTHGREASGGTHETAETAMDAESSEVPATSSTRMNSSGSSDGGFDLSNAYESFIAEGSETGYICLTCAEVCMAEAEIVEHILENHIKRDPSEKKSTGVMPESTTTTSEVSSKATRRKQALPSTHVFSEVERAAVDKLILNILNTQPPYTCKVCHWSSQVKQRARIHVLFKHRDDLDLP